MSAPRALLVPGAALWTDGRPRAALRSRLATALDETRDDPDTLILVSGGAVNTEHSEAAAMARWLEAQGFPRERLILEEQARSTTQNADLALPLLVSRGIRSVTVVSQPFHAQRTHFNLRVAARRAGVALAIDVRHAPLPPPHDPLRWSAAELIKLCSDALCRIFPEAAELLQRWRW